MLLPYLTDIEIREMAAPLTQPAAIIRWCIGQGFTVRKKPNGMPLISRAHFESQLSQSLIQEQKKDDATVTPDVAAFLSRFKKGVGYGNGKTSNQQPSRT